MLETSSTLPVVPIWEKTDHRPKILANPSFGLGSLRSRKELVVFSTIAFLTIGLLYAAFRPTVYTASSELLVYIKQIQPGPDLAVLPGRADLPLVQNQIELLRSGNVLVKTVETLKLYDDAEFANKYVVSDTPNSAQEKGAAFGAAVETLVTKLRIRQVGPSHVVSVAYQASDPAKAARVVNAVIHIYLGELIRASDTGSPALRELYQSLGPSASVISDAQPPIRPDGAPAILIVLGGALLGFLVGSSIALLRDALSDTIRGAPQVEHALGMRCLGAIGRRVDQGIGIEDAVAQRSRVSEQEALRRLAANILEASLHRDLRTLGVTSTVPGEGVTTLTIALAQTVAAAGKRVLLIDGVPDNRSVSRWAINLPRIPVRSSPSSSVFDDIVEGPAGLHVLPLREPSSGDIYLFGPALLDGILNNTAASYDLVIVDMPSLVIGPDVRAAAQSLDGFLLVVKWGATESELVRQALKSAGEAWPKFVGAVLNMTDYEMTKCYGYDSVAEL